MSAVKSFQESVKISRYARPGVSPAPAAGSFTVTRSGTSAVSSGATTDLTAETEVKAQFVVTWSERNGSHRREFSAAFHGPSYRVSLKGNAEWYGSLTCYSYSISGGGNGGLLYDEALGSAGFIRKFEIASSYEDSRQ